MSFVWKRPEGRLKSPEQCAREILEVAIARGLDEFAAVLAVMCVAQESDFWCPWNAKDDSSHNYPFDSESDDGRSVGYFQQQNGRGGDTLPAGDRDNWWGPMAQRMDLKKSANEFLSRLEDNYRDAINDPGMASSRFIQNVQKSAYPSAYAKHWDRAWALVRAAQSGQPPQEKPVTDPNRPDFNEYPMWSPNNSDRRGTKIDLFLLHTQEGNGNADSLAKYLQGNNVSYHYTVSEDVNDHGVTVVDVVDTDQSAWSVLSANPRSINLCFAGSRAAWSRAEWLKQGRAIDVAAYIAVQDCKKYGIPTKVLAPPYKSDPPGISDHNYVTRVLKDGTHTDVGPNFPWDVFAAAVNKYASVASPRPGPPEPDPVKKFPDDWTDRELLVEVLKQLRGPTLSGWQQLGGKSVVDYLAKDAK